MTRGPGGSRGQAGRGRQDACHQSLDLHARSTTSPSWFCFSTQSDLTRPCVVSVENGSSYVAHPTPHRRSNIFVYAALPYHSPDAWAAGVRASEPTLAE